MEVGWKQSSLLAACRVGAQAVDVNSAHCSTSTLVFMCWSQTTAFDFWGHPYTPSSGVWWLSVAESLLYQPGFLVVLGKKQSLVSWYLLSREVVVSTVRTQWADGDGMQQLYEPVAGTCQISHWSVGNSLWWNTPNIRWSFVTSLCVGYVYCVNYFGKIQADIFLIKWL